jgi:hypothetical protein
MKAPSNGNIIYSNILPADVKRSTSIYGPSTLALQGRTTQQRSEIFPPSELPRITDVQSIYADIFTANATSFLITVAKPLDHILTSHIDSKGTNTLRKTFRAHLGFYGQKRVDNEKGITLAHCAPGAHVHIVERAIRNVK